MWLCAFVLGVALWVPRSGKSAQGSVAASVSVCEASLKILPWQGPTQQKSVQLFAAKNEFEACQLVIYGGDTGLRGVTLSPPTLSTSTGATFSKSNVRLFREGYVNLTRASNSEGGTGAYPDPLIPDIDETVGEKRSAFPFDVPARQNRVLWVEFFVPTTTKAGIYKGNFTLMAAGAPGSSGNSRTFSVPVQLEVWNFALPSTASLRSFFGLGTSVACNAYYGSYEGCGAKEGAGGNPEKGLLLTKVELARFLLDHRISGEVIYTGPDVQDDGSYNWMDWDGWYKTLWDGSDARLRLKGARLTSVRHNWVLKGQPDYFEKPTYYHAWADHAKQKGWLERTFQYKDKLDEPTTPEQWNAIPPTAALAHGANPAFRSLVTTTLFQAKGHDVLSSIDILAPPINLMDDKDTSPLREQTGDPPGNQRPSYDAFLAGKATRQVWMYQSCQSHGCSSEMANNPYYSGWPSYMIDASAVQNRAMEWMSFIYRTQGELYYSLDTKLPTAWTDQFFQGGNGDGTLFYPGTASRIGGRTPVPVASIRLKMIREGMEDYEYLKKVADLGGADGSAFAMKTASTLFPHAYQAHPTCAALMSARKALANRILLLQGQASSRHSAFQ